MTRWSPLKAGMFSSQFTHEPLRPWMKMIVRSPEPMSMTFIERPPTSTHR
jgi:hypothetical protein